MMEKFKEVFKEEAADLLNQLENLLMELEEDPCDSEKIAASFRCMHTIKGNAAMFGFNVISQYAHNLESALDSLREGKIKVSKALIDLMLTAADDINELLDADGESTQRITDSSVYVIEKLRLLTEENYSDSLLVAVEEQGSFADTAPLNNESTYRICFQPDPDVFLSGTNPLLILAELEDLGELSCTCDLTKIPSFDKIDPERCYVKWEIFLTTNVSENDIRDVFIFVEGSSHVEIKKIQNISLAGDEPAARKLEAPPFAEQKNIRTSHHEVNIKVGSEKLDSLVDLAGELVTAQARLSTVCNEIKTDELIIVTEQIERLTSNLREGIMSMRMLPIGATFNKFRRLIRDLSGELGKDIELITDGEETELDKTVIERLQDPLVHLIRNCIDHGIEKPAARKALGKPGTGIVRLSAYHSGTSVVISIEDDGGGLDKDAILAKALNKGIISRETDISEQEAFNLIFTPGFSTAAEVTDVSGRGVGMDVVRREIEELQGGVTITSRKGKGTCICLRIPLTLAIIDGLLIRAGGQNFVLPLPSVEGCHEFGKVEKAKKSGNQIIENGGMLIPYVDLEDVLELDNLQKQDRQMIIVQGTNMRFGLIIDEVVGNCQTVIKPLRMIVKDVEGVSGASILGDGSIALILDVNSLGNRL